MRSALLACVAAFVAGCGNTSESKERDFKDEAWLFAEQEILKYLESPSSAEFGNQSRERVTKTETNQYIVTGWVDSKNGAGAKVRTEYGMTVRVDPQTTGNYRWKVIGKPIIKSK